jgi:hypothetical protein
MDHNILFISDELLLKISSRKIRVENNIELIKADQTNESISVPEQNETYLV